MYVINKYFSAFIFKFFKIIIIIIIIMVSFVIFLDGSFSSRLAKLELF